MASLKYKSLYEAGLLALEGKKLRIVLESAGIKSIAIYGMGYLGKILYHLLTKNSINVAYALDKNTSLVIPGLEIIDPQISELPETDIIIITTENDNKIIMQNLKAKSHAKMVLAKDFLDELLISNMTNSV